MKRIEKDELYQHLSGFLTTKGIELKDGSYTKRVQQGCSILADLINLSQNGIEKAKTKADESIDRLRQVIHEKTAPKPPKTAAEPPPSQPRDTSAKAAEPSPAPEPAAAPPKAKRKTAAKKVVRKRTA